MAKKKACTSKSSATGRKLQGRRPAVTDLKGKSSLGIQDDAEFIELAFEAYIKHAHQGWPDDSFYYRRGDDGINARRLLSRLPLHAKRLDLSRIDEVTAHRYMHWLQMGVNMILEKGSPALYLSFMARIFPHFGWGETQAAVSVKPDVERLLAHIKES